MRGRLLLNSHGSVRWEAYWWRVPKPILVASGASRYLLLKQVHTDIRIPTTRDVPDLADVGLLYSRGWWRVSTLLIVNHNKPREVRDTFEVWNCSAWKNGRFAYRSKNVYWVFTNLEVTRVCGRCGRCGRWKKRKLEDVEDSFVAWLYQEKGRKPLNLCCLLLCSVFCNSCNEDKDLLRHSTSSTCYYSPGFTKSTEQKERKLHTGMKPPRVNMSVKWKMIETRDTMLKW